HSVSLWVFAPAVFACCADKRHQRRLAQQEPSDAELGRRAAFIGGESLQLIDELLVLPRVLALKTRHITAEVVLRHAVASSNDAGQETATKRRVSEKADTELMAKGKDFLLYVARP